MRCPLASASHQCVLSVFANAPLSDTFVHNHSNEGVLCNTLQSGILMRMRIRHNIIEIIAQCKREFTDVTSVFSKVTALRACQRVHCSVIVTQVQNASACACVSTAAECYEVLHAPWLTCAESKGGGGDSMRSWCRRRFNTGIFGCCHVHCRKDGTG